MILSTTAALAESRVRDMRRHTTHPVHDTAAEDWPGLRGRSRRPRLRSRLGYTLLEAGLHLLADPARTPQ